MPDRALQMPFAEDEAARVGRNVFRKQILPVGSIDYEGRKLEFTPDYLRGLAKNFNGGAFDQVAFQLADGENSHTFDPERFRGEVKAMELADDGLYGIVEMTDDGAEVVQKNPKLGVSARIIEGIEKGGNAIQHVLGTLDPRVTGMKPWETVSLANTPDEVVDLTAAEFAGASDPPARSDSSTVTPPKPAERKPEEILADLLNTDTDDDQPKVPVAALSAEDRRAIELAASEARDAKADAAAARTTLANERFERLEAELVAAGVPPADVKLAEPILRGGSSAIELANGEKVDAHSVVTQLLESRKGTIDLTTVGADASVEDSEAAEAKRIAKEMEEAGI